MPIFELNKSKIESAVSLADLLKKYNTPRRLKKMQPLYERMLKEVAELAQPQLLFTEKPIGELPGLAPLLNAETAVVLLAVCTMGEAVDQRYETYLGDEIFLAAILDEISLQWIVHMTQQFHRQIRAEFTKKNLKVGPAFRPGVGKMPIEVQTIVFDHLPAEEIGVRLSEVLMMTPIRSTSLVIPVFDRSASRVD